MKKYAAIFNFVPQLNEQVLISAENEEQALMTVYFAAHEACSWPKETVTVKGIWAVGDIPGSVTDTLKQKRKEKQYSVPYEYIEKNILTIKCRKGTIIDHSIISPMTMKEDMKRSKKKLDEFESMAKRA